MLSPQFDCPLLPSFVPLYLPIPLLLQGLSGLLAFGHPRLLFCSHMLTAPALLLLSTSDPSESQTLGPHCLDCILRMEKMQYQAPLKATGGIQGSRRETINRIEAVESMPTKLCSMQTRHIARNLEGPSVNQDIYPPDWSLKDREEEDVQLRREGNGGTMG